MFIVDDDNDDDDDDNDNDHKDDYNDFILWCVLTTPINVVVVVAIPQHCSRFSGKYHLSQADSVWKPISANSALMWLLHGFLMDFLMDTYQPSKFGTVIELLTPKRFFIILAFQMRPAQLLCRLVMDFFMVVQFPSCFGAKSALPASKWRFIRMNLSVIFQLTLFREKLWANTAFIYVFFFLMASHMVIQIFFLTCAKIAHFAVERFFTRFICCFVLPSQVNFNCCF